MNLSAVSIPNAVGPAAKGCSVEWDDTPGKPDPSWSVYQRKRLPVLSATEVTKAHRSADRCASYEISIELVRLSTFLCYVKIIPEKYAPASDPALRRFPAGHPHIPAPCNGLRTNHRPVGPKFPDAAPASSVNRVF